MQLRLMGNALFSKIQPHVRGDKDKKKIKKS